MVTGGLRLTLLLTGILLAGCLDNGVVPDDDEEIPDDEPAFDQVEIPCHERDRIVAYPWEQQVDDSTQIRCPGHYAITEEGDGPSMEVPVWKHGDWWHYRGSIQESTTAAQCAEYRDEVNGPATYLNLSVYEVSRVALECDGPGQQSRDRYYTDTSLSWAMTSLEGFIRHETLFPLVDGKSWSYMDRPNGNIVEAEVTHDDDYTFDGETLEVWRIELTGRDLQTQEQWRQVVWYHEDARNRLREEFHKAGVQQYFWQLVDSVDGYGEDPGIV